MILDKIENLALYGNLLPGIDKVMEFLASHDLEQLPFGHYEIEGADIFVNIDNAHGRSLSDARLESHNRMADIQLIFGNTEQIGWSPRSELKEVPYDEMADFSLYDETPQQLLTLKPGQFMLFLPQDGHAPLISACPSYRKAIFKLRVQG